MYTYIYIHVYEYVYTCIYIFMCAWCFSSSDEYESYMYIYILLPINYSCIRTSSFLFYCPVLLPFFNAMYSLSAYKVRLGVVIDIRQLANG